MPRRGPPAPDRGRRTAAPDGADAAAPPRIIGGTLRGRKLPFLPDPRTRPMKDRVRETLFDLLGTDVPGTVAIDLFAGSGALGLEALSRGAARAILVERHFPTADRLRAAATELGVADRVEVRPGDVLVWARRLPPLPDDKPWLVFVSPPWEMFISRGADVVALVAALQGAAPPRSTVVVEADTAFDQARLPGTGWTSRALPPAVLHLWRQGG